MTTTYKQFKTKSFKNKKIKEEYDALSIEYEIVQAIIKHRLKLGMSQSQLAKAIGSRQPVISRLERGNGNPSLRTLQKIADALNLSLKVSMK